MGGVRERTKQGTETDEYIWVDVLALNSSKLCQLHHPPPTKPLLQMVQSVGERNKKFPHHHLLLKMSRGGTLLTRVQSFECDRPKLRCPFCCMAAAGATFKTPLIYHLIGINQPRMERLK